jgi:ribosomal-protein-alanine N-acetyltransferase
MMDARSRICTARLVWRPVEAGDVDALHRLWTDPDVRRYLLDDIVITRERATAEIAGSLESFAAHGYGLWVVTLAEEAGLPRFAGCVGLRPAGGVAELMLSFMPAFWRHGLAVEAGAALIAYGFGLGLPRILGRTDPPNAASIRVMEKLGMRRLPDTNLVNFAIDDPARSTVV